MADIKSKVVVNQLIKINGKNTKIWKAKLLGLAARILGIYLDINTDVNINIDPEIKKMRIR